MNRTDRPKVSIRQLAIEYIRSDFVLLSYLAECGLVPERCSEGTSQETRMIRAVNHFRAAKGLYPLGEEPVFNIVPYPAKTQKAEPWKPTARTEQGRAECRKVAEAAMKRGELRVETAPLHLIVPSGKRSEQRTDI